MTDSQEQESPVIAQMRKQLKEAQRDLADKDKAIQAAKAEGYREARLEHALEALGQPMAVKGLVADALDDDFIDAHTVAEALRGLGFNTQDPVSGPSGAPEPPEGSTRAPEPAPEQIAAFQAVTDLSSQVQSAANHSGGEDFYDGLNKTDTPEALAAYMRKQGLGS